MSRCQEDRNSCLPITEKRSGPIASAVCLHGFVFLTGTHDGEISLDRSLTYSTITNWHRMFERSNSDVGSVI